MEIRLPLPAYAYRFDLLLEFARRIAYPARMLAAGDSLWRHTCGHLCAYRQERESIVIRTDSATDADAARITRASRHILGLDRDLSRFYAMARGHEPLWNVIEPLTGLPIHCSETVFEALISLIIEQHITWKTALRSQRRLLRMLGNVAHADGRHVYDFPKPAQLAGATVAMLKPLKITNRRIALIIDIASAAARGELDLESIRDLPLDKAYQRLLKLKGVGSWTAGNVIGRATGRYPHVSENDVALQAAMRRYFSVGQGEKSASAVREALEPYGEFAGLASHFVLLRWVFDRYPVADGDS